MSELKPLSIPAGIAIPAPAVHLPAILKAEEVANLLRINRKTLYEAVQRGEVPGTLRIGRCLRFQRDAVLEWMSNHRAIPNPKEQG